jgi:hypothetical protein
MNLPEVFFHLDHLPSLDQYYVDQGHKAVYSYPSIDFVDERLFNARIEGKDKSVSPQIIKQKIIPTPSAVQHENPVDQSRHSNTSRTISAKCDFSQSKFAQDMTRDLGEVGSSYFYNPPWGLYDWHRDLARHDCAINFLLTDTPDARTMFRFPSDCDKNWYISCLHYKLFRPVLIHSKTQHCVANLTDKHRYILSLVVFDATYDQTKEWLLNYNCTSYNN